MRSTFSPAITWKLLSALLVGGTASTSTFAQAHASTVTVQKGDTVSNIAQSHNISVSSIVSANHLANKNLITPGQQLSINGSNNTYTVKTGDTLWGIAKANNLDLGQLMEQNGISPSNTTIYVGQQLKLSGTATSDKSADNNQPVGQTNSGTSSASTNNQQQAQVTPTSGPTPVQSQQPAQPSQTPQPAAQSTPTNVNATTTAASAQPANTSNYGQQTATPTGNSVAQQAVSLALQYAHMGIPYVWGGSSPAGFDCSGLTQYIYHQLGININRTAAAQVANTTTKPVSQAQPGDLLFWGNGSGVYHVAIYIGNNQFVAAPQPGENVDVETISPYFMPSFAGTVNQ